MTATYLVEPRAAIVAARPPLWRWLLGGIAPIATLFLTHAGLYPGLPAHAFGWRLLPILLMFPGILIVWGHFFNLHVLQGSGRTEPRAWMRLLFWTLPMTSLTIVIIGVPAALVLSAPVMLPVLFIAKASWLHSSVNWVLHMTAGAALYGVAGWFAGIVVSVSEDSSPSRPYGDSREMQMAHRWGGVAAAWIAMLGWGAATALTGGSSNVPGIQAVAALVIPTAALPHLVLTWRALTPGTAPWVADAEFLLRLAATLFAILALAAIEGVLLGNGI